MYIGLNSSTLNKVFAAQRDSMWCWAASLQMIFHHFGLNITQELIVKRTFGRTPYGTLPNKPGDFMHIMKALNNWGVDSHGKHYRVKAHIMGGAPAPTLIVQELMQKHPILFCYQSRPQMNHAVLITGAELANKDNTIVLKSIIVRDPSPNAKNRAANGRREYRARTILSKSSAYFLVRVQTE